jgi:hypothetical protein
MIRPPLEVADIVRTYGTAFVKQQGRWLTALHLRVLRAIVACRTAALGGHIEQCDSCGQRAISYNSCLNRHCPKCQAAARQTWLAERSAELLPVPYYHVVFTLPHLLAPLALQNKALVYALLFRAVAETLLQIAADPKRLGAKIGFMAVLHTWARPCCIIPMSIVWSRREGSRPIIGDGFPADPSSFCPSTYSVLSFAESFSKLSKALLRNTSLFWPANLPLYNLPPISPPCYAPRHNQTGLFMPSDPLPDPHKSSPISLVIPTALPSLTLGWWLWPTVASPSVGEITPTGTRREP